MQRGFQRISSAVSERFRALDRLLHIDHRGRSEWIWAVPILTFAGTFALVAFAGTVVSGVTPALYVPIGVIVAALTAGMSVAYMTPEADSGEDHGGGGWDAPQAPPAPPRPGWARWLRTWRDEELPEEPAPPRRERTGSGSER